MNWEVRGTLNGEPIVLAHETDDECSRADARDEMQHSVPKINGEFKGFPKVDWRTLRRISLSPNLTALHLASLYKINPRKHRQRGTDNHALWLPIINLPKKRVLCLLIGDCALASVPIEALEIVTPDEVHSYVRDNFLHHSVNNNIKLPPLVTPSGVAETGRRGGREA